MFAYRLGKHFDSLAQVASKLSKAPSPPDGVCVLGRGILLRSSGEAVRRHKSIKKGEPLDPVAWDSDALKADLDNLGSNEVRYLVEETAENKVVLLFFHSFLLFLLEQQTVSASTPTDFIAAWRRT